MKAPSKAAMTRRAEVADLSWPLKADSAKRSVSGELEGCFEEEPMLFVEAPGPPVPKRRARVYVGDDNKIHARSQAKSSKYEAHLATLARFACASQGWPVGGWAARSVRYAVLVEAVLEADEGDADNIAKSWKDSLNGIAWPDDRRVCLLLVSRRVAAPNEAPRATCRVWALGTKEIDE
jgi:Endodeoxyribonuclease RusA